MVGSHETIPDIQVEPVVSFESLMMHDVIGRCVDDLAQPRVHQPTWRVLVAGVPRHIVNDLPKHEQAEGVKVHGDEKHHHWKDGGLGQGFERRKRV